MTVPAVASTRFSAPSLQNSEFMVSSLSADAAHEIHTRRYLSAGGWGSSVGTGFQTYVAPALAATLVNQGSPGVQALLPEYHLVWVSDDDERYLSRKLLLILWHRCQNNIRTCWYVRSARRSWCRRWPVADGSRTLRSERLDSRTRVG